jgi:hypothetical protein
MYNDKSFWVYFYNNNPVYVMKGSFYLNDISNKYHHVYIYIKYFILLFEKPSSIVWKSLFSSLPKGMNIIH